MSSTALAWRSSLYPVDWTPSFTDESGRFLHDFSYAGYKMQGEDAIPANPPGATYNVTQSPYNADNTGTNDATAAIQAAIDDAEAAGGGIVFMPAGTYKVSPGTNTWCLRIEEDGVVLRGAGPGSTFLYCSEPNMRKKSVISISGDSFPVENAPIIDLAADADNRDTVISLESVDGLAVGDYITLRADNTAAFKVDHGMTGKWPETASDAKGMIFARRIAAIDSAAKTVTIDIPLRYWLKTRDNARIHATSDPTEEVGIEDFSIGMKQSALPSGGISAFNTPGKMEYETHSSKVIMFWGSRNCWVKNVHTYKPCANTGDFHIASQGINLSTSRLITVVDCKMSKPQNEAGGGNGYLFFHKGQENMFLRCEALSGRHNFTYTGMQCSGNVNKDCKTISPLLVLDFHAYFSVANLIEGMDVGDDRMEAKNRGDISNGAGHTTSQSVFWNSFSNSDTGTIIDSQQFGFGYVIGTSGTKTTIAGNDFEEGEGTGDTLEPQSLYDDQYSKRISRNP